MSDRIRLDRIVFDAGTQVRAALDPDHVTSIAEAMSAGATLPPITLFHDGSHYYIADGFHRFMAAQRNEWREIDADVKAGTKTDALWFALGANRTNGKNMTRADKRHAIELALRTWGESKSSTQIADQMGIHHQRVSETRAVMRMEVIQASESETCIEGLQPVTGKDGKSYPVSRSAKPSQSRKPVREPKFKSRAAVSQRHERMRTMAEEGYTTRQIAAAIGLSEEGCRHTIRKAGIDVPADRAVGKAKRHNSTRIIEAIVMDAENLVADAGLIDFGALERARIAEWLTSLKASREKLSMFIRRLMQEQQKHGEAA